MSCSLCESMAEVASSRMRMAGSRRIARASAIRCRCPCMARTSFGVAGRASGPRAAWSAGGCWTPASPIAATAVRCSNQSSGTVVSGALGLVARVSLQYSMLRRNRWCYGQALMAGSRDTPARFKGSANGRRYSSCRKFASFLRAELALLGEGNKNAKRSPIRRAFHD